MSSSSQNPASKGVSSTNSPGVVPHSPTPAQPRQANASTMSPYSSGSAGAQQGEAYPTAAPELGSLQTASGPYDPSSVMTKLHPAIRAQYAAMLQRTNPQLHAQIQSQAPAPSQAQVQVQKPYYSQAYQAPHPVVQGPGTQQAVSSMQHGHHASQIPPQTQSRAQQVSKFTARQSGPPIQTQAQAQVYPDRPQSYALHVQSAPSVTSIQTTAAQGVQNGSNKAQSPQSMPTQASHASQPAPKQTFVPPPRPWEQLQRAGQSNPAPAPATTPIVPAGVLSMPTNKDAEPSQPISQGLQPSNVSGP